MIKAVGFTGSRAAGTALMRTAAARPQPIPVCAEMSSINPVIIMPCVLETGAQDLAAGFTASLTLGAGQFCTNPGPVFVPVADKGFVETAEGLLAAAVGQTMLTPRVSSSYTDGVQRLTSMPGVQFIAAGTESLGENGPEPVLFATGMAAFLSNPELQEECSAPPPASSATTMKRTSSLPWKICKVSLPRRCTPRMRILPQCGGSCRSWNARRAGFSLQWMADGRRG